MTDTVQDPHQGSQTRELLGHPIGLSICFLTEMWERFSFYGMRTILVLYLVKYHLFSAEKSSLIYGAYAGLVYMMPILGGYMADRYLGSRRAVTYGAILLVAGHSLMALHGPRAEKYMTIDGVEHQVQFEQVMEPNKEGVVKSTEESFLTIDGAKYMVQDVVDEHEKVTGIKLAPTVPGAGSERMIPAGNFDVRILQHTEYLNIFFLSLALIITGVGFLKANISTIVGALYGPHDPRRDGGFSIFYMGINLGSLISTLLVGWVGETYGWNYGFGLAGIGMAFGLVVFLWGQRFLDGRAEAPAPAVLKEKSPIGLNKEYTIYLGGFGLVALSWFLMQYQELVTGLVAVIGLIMLGIIIVYAVTKCDKVARNRLLVASFLIAIQSVFWALFEQQAASLTLLADQQFNLNLFGWQLKASMVQFLNPGFIMVFAPVFAWMWVKMSNKNMEPSTPGKFGIAMLLIGIGYIIFSWGLGLNDSTDKSFFWLFFIYLMLTLAELCLSPVGLSMVTKLSVPAIVGMMMGTWFLFTALGNNLAGVISSWTGAGEGAEAGALDMGALMGVYTDIGILSVVVGVGILVLTPILKKGMHGVH